MLEIEAWYYWAIDGRNHTSGWRMAVSPLHCCYLESRSSHWKHLSITCSAFHFRFEYMWHIPGFTVRPSVEYGLFDIKMEWSVKDLRVWGIYFVNNNSKKRERKDVNSLPPKSNWIPKYGKQLFPNFKLFWNISRRILGSLAQDWRIRWKLCVQ